MQKDILRTIEAQAKLASSVRTVSDERMLIIAKAEIKRCIKQVPASKMRLMEAGLEIPVLELNVPDVGPKSYERFFGAVKKLIVVRPEDDYTLEFVEGHHSAEIVKVGLLDRKMDYF